MRATMTNPAGQTAVAQANGIGLQGWVTVAWTAAGGIALGGLLVALMTLSGQLSGQGLFMTASGLYVIGALIGLVHGIVLGYLGRADGVPKRRALRDVGMGAVYAMVALPFAWVVTMWIALSMPAAFAGKAMALAGVGMGWVAGTFVVGAAAVAGWRALGNAWLRWPERRVGTLLVAATFAALLVLFLTDRPEIWALQVRVTEVGAVLLAGLGTLWLAGPIITLALRLLAGMPGRHPMPGFAPGWRIAGDLALGLTVGVVLGLVVAPFAVPAALPGSLGAGFAGGVLAAVGQALVDEVLLRLFLVTGAVWLLLRSGAVRPAIAAPASIGIAALIQVVLYAPGVASIGFPSVLGMLGFVATMVVLPALVFGALFWKRGIGAALVADAAALAVLVAIV